MSFPTFISKKLWNSDIYNFYGEKFNFGLFFSENRQFMQNLQLWRDCDVIHGMFVLFGTYGKRRPIMYTSDIYFSSSQGELQQALLDMLDARVTRNGLSVWQRVKQNHVISGERFIHWRWWNSLRCYCLCKYCWSHVSVGWKQHWAGPSRSRQYIKSGKEEVPW